MFLKLDEIILHLFTDMPHVHCALVTGSSFLNSRVCDVFYQSQYITNIMTLLCIRTNRTSWIKRDQLDVTCFFISLVHAQHVTDVNTSILSILQLICWVISWVVEVIALVYLFSGECLVVTCVVVLTSETCWARNNEIKKQVTSSWSLFIQLSRWCTVQ